MEAKDNGMITRNLITMNLEKSISTWINTAHLILKLDINYYADSSDWSSLEKIIDTKHKKEKIMDVFWLVLSFLDSNSS